MTSREIAALFPEERYADVSSLVARFTQAVTKTAYIHSWTREPVHGREYLRAVYAVGNLPDARKPRVLTDRERRARYRAKQRVAPAHTGLVNSVFALGGLL